MLAEAVIPHCPSLVAAVSVLEARLTRAVVAAELVVPVEEQEAARAAATCKP